MQTVKQTISDVTYIMGASRSRVNSIARALIDAGILPKSSGRAIMKVDAIQLSGLLAAVALADKVEDAAAIATSVMDMTLEGMPGTQTFKGAFAESMNSSDSKAQPEIVFGKTANGYTAKISGTFIHHGELCDGLLPFYEHQLWGGWTRTDVTLSAEGFEILRNLCRKVYDADGHPVYEFKG